MRFLLFVFVAIVSLEAKGLDVRPVDNELYKKECASRRCGCQPAH